MSNEVRVARHVAMGDPQAPIAAVLEVLRENQILDEDGFVRGDTHLVVMGDYFDWGPREERIRAGESGEELLEWLSSHRASDVTLLLGNHDLARVGELAHVDDASFARAQEEADVAYFDDQPRRPKEAFSEATGFASWEIVARDLSTFRASQRVLVERLLREGRFAIAHAPSDDLLLTHAGVTTRELAVLGLDAHETSAKLIADRLNTALRDAVLAWTSGPFAIEGLHRPGDANGEGVGMFYHRPEVRDAASPANESVGAMARRYDVATLPNGLTQGLGHIRDAKCRTLLGAPKRVEPEGRLHHAIIRRGVTAYGDGYPASCPRDAAALVFLDGGMQHVDPQRYELLDLVARVPLGAGR